MQTAEKQITGLAFIGEDFTPENVELTIENGMLYNIHHPINPETFPGKAHDYAGIVKPILDIGEY